MYIDAKFQILCHVFYIQNCKHLLLRNSLIYKYVCIEIPASKNPF